MKKDGENNELLMMPRRKLLGGAAAMAALSLAPGRLLKSAMASSLCLVFESWYAGIIRKNKPANPAAKIKIHS